MKSKLVFQSSSAMFSPDRRYRYMLHRTWDENLSAVCFLMLNPSTADEKVLDPTVRRCVGYAKAWGFGTLYVANIFALRSTDPAALTQVEDPIGPENDEWILKLSRISIYTIAAWGVHGALRNRGNDVVALLKNKLPDRSLCALKMTKDGHPCHPLYLAKTLAPVVYRGAL